MTYVIITLIWECGLTPGITTYSLHPGIAATGMASQLDRTIFRGAKSIALTLGKPFIKSPERGAQTSIYCAVDENAGKQSGLYYKSVITSSVITTPSTFYY